MNNEIQNKINSVEFDFHKWEQARPEDVSRRKLSRMLGTSDSNLLSIERGRSLPSIQLAFKYCILTGIEPNDLMISN